ncbi:hypothetical protein [Trinickia acidisoli]|uniref:hypothetical protein n=1 Tax=Trinickia acidisoli TaxID=2767482 RepID=UPI001A8C9110|nr:hypothetical protein [Trinickia acidisoli]
MRTTKSGYFSNFSSYWPVALALALIAAAMLHAYGGSAAPREPLAADQVTAELARTVSYGLIDSVSVHAASAVRHVASPTAQAS